MILLMSLLIGISAATVVWVIFMIEKNLSPNTLRRLEKIKRKTNNETQEKINLDLPNYEYKIPYLEHILRKYKITEDIKKLIKLANVRLEVDTFIFLSLLCGLPFLIFLITPFALLSILSIPAIFLPKLYLDSLINKRFLDFSKQFPDALNLMASSLRAGHTLNAAITIVAEEMPQPMSEVFITLQKDISLGIDTKEAFINMTQLIPKSIDLKFFSTAVLIQKEVGGNLAELLDKLSETIRERFKLLGQLRVQTAQTRLSGMIIAIVPIGVMLALLCLNPTYVKPLFNTPDGKLALVGAICLIIVGLFSIKKISSIDI